MPHPSGHYPDDIIRTVFLLLSNLPLPLPLFPCVILCKPLTENRVTFMTGFCLLDWGIKRTCIYWWHLWAKYTIHEWFMDLWSFLLHQYSYLRLGPTNPSLGQWSEWSSHWNLFNELETRSERSRYFGPIIIVDGVSQRRHVFSFGNLTNYFLFIVKSSLCSSPPVVRSVFPSVYVSFSLHFFTRTEYW